MTLFFANNLDRHSDAQLAVQDDFNGMLAEQANRAVGHVDFATLDLHTLLPSSITRASAINARSAPSSDSGTMASI